MSSLHEVGSSKENSEPPDETEDETNDRQDQKNVNGGAEEVQA